MNIIKQAAGIALLALILGFAINHIRQDGLSVIESQEDLFPQSLEEKELEGISIEDAQEILNAGKSIFVDLRPKDDFDRSHTPKSLNFPSKHTHNLFAFLDQQISKQTEIILIGADKEDYTPTEVGLLLQMMGYENVKIMAEGLKGWEQRKEKTKNISPPRTPRSAKTRYDRK
jgi:rhodanese-related sulfurtransferase